MRVILVPVADRPECARALNTAFELGKKLNASVNGCHIRPHKESDLTLSSEFADAAWRKKSTADAPVAAESLYRKIAEEHGYEMISHARAYPDAMWAERYGTPDTVRGIFGPILHLSGESRPMRPNAFARKIVAPAHMRGSSRIL